MRAATPHCDWHFLLSLESSRQRVQHILVMCDSPRSPHTGTCRSGPGACCDPPQWVSAASCRRSCPAPLWSARSSSRGKTPARTAESVVRVLTEGPSYWSLSLVCLCDLDELVMLLWSDKKRQVNLRNICKVFPKTIQNSSQSRIISLGKVLYFHANI